MLHVLTIVAAAASLAVPTGIDLRVMRHPHTTAHYLQIEYDVEVAGVKAKETGIYDLDDGRYVERLSAGPLSSSSGFDGEHSWTADVTGFAIVDDHPSSVVDELAAAHFQGRRGPEEPTIEVGKSTSSTRSFALRYAGLTGPIGVTLSQRGGHVLAIDDYSQVDATHVRYGDYRTVDGFDLPFSSVSHSPERTSVDRIRALEPLASVEANTFVAPREPRDYAIDGASTTSVSLGDLRYDEPVVGVRVDGGPVLHMLFDSGSSNTMSTRTARRLGLVSSGNDLTGGIGTGMLRERFAIVKRMQIGAAVLRDQPFAIFDDTSSTTDGTIGCEVLERFAARFDFPNRRLTLALHSASFRGRYDPIAMHLEGCQPEVPASFDGYSGAFGIDTGSGSELDVMAPYVRSRDLIARYHAKIRYDGVGIGGKIYAGLAHAKRMKLGGYTIDDVPIDLSEMHGGAFDDPSQVGNIGVGLLRDFVVTFDYRARRMWLDT